MLQFSPASNRKEQPAPVLCVVLLLFDSGFGSSLLLLLLLLLLRCHVSRNIVRFIDSQQSDLGQ